ncbi:hypothetical protein PCL_09455 [Purpureocillium lilacinum]|uniref:Uncharacterized protein n=1 Tax=Purpureocillium lilacinum TaxID=33203 RepID=A0A2U3DQW5_PURLI|nr:hypothetical protein PCL_09455 [Purpureocillium lilacinum]
MSQPRTVHPRRLKHRITSALGGSFCGTADGRPRDNGPKNQDPDQGQGLGRNRDPGQELPAGRERAGRLGEQSLTCPLPACASNCAPSRARYSVLPSVLQRRPPVLVYRGRSTHVYIRTPYQVSVVPYYVATVCKSPQSATPSLHPRPPLIGLTLSLQVSLTPHTSLVNTLRRRRRRGATHRSSGGLSCLLFPHRSLASGKGGAGPRQQSRSNPAPRPCTRNQKATTPTSSMLRQAVRPPPAPGSTPCNLATRRLPPFSGQLAARTHCLTRVRVFDPRPHLSCVAGPLLYHQPAGPPPIPSTDRLSCCQYPSSIRGPDRGSAAGHVVRGTQGVGPHWQA